MGQRLQGHGQKHPLELAAGQASHGLVQQVLPVDSGQTAGHQLPVAPGHGQADRPAGDGGGEEVQYAHRVPPVKAGGLGHIADEGAGPPGGEGSVGPVGQPDGRPVGRGEGDGAGVWHLPQDAAEQGGLARPVGADEGGDLSAVEVEGHILQDVLPLDVDRQALQLQAAGVGAAPGQPAVLDLSHS